MSNKSNFTSISLRTETFELLSSIKSCFQLKYKKSISYDEIIKTYLIDGIEAKEPQIAEILNFVNKSSGQQTIPEEVEVINNVNDNEE